MLSIRSRPKSRPTVPREVANASREETLIYRSGPYTVVRPGETCAGEAAEVFEHCLQMASSGHSPAVIVDLKDVNVLAPQTIFNLKAVSDRVTDSRGLMVVGNVRPHIMQIFESISLDEMIKISPDLDKWLVTAAAI